MKKTIKTLALSAVTLLIISAFILSAAAHEAPDLSRADCSLKIKMTYNGEALAGGTVTLYRAGSITENDGNYGFEWLPSLNCTADINALDAQAAAEAEKCVKASLAYGITVEVDKDGFAEFSPLPVGLYLAVQEQAPDGFEPIKPFLISLPQSADGRYEYNVTASSKTEPQTLPENTTNPEETTAPEVPDTGVMKWPVPLLAVLGAALLLIGLVIKRTKKNV